MTLSVKLEGVASINGTPLFGPLSLTVQAGGWTCLLGPSGVGKSTLLRLIAGLEVGADFTGFVTASDGAPVAPRVAYMAQEDLLLPWASLRRNAGLGARLRGEREDRENKAKVDRLLAQVGLAALADRKPHAVSGGQRQRAALARTLMEEKAIILLDEPFSALDARTRADMQDLAHRLLAGKTVLLVTHDPAEAARLGDQILILTETGLRMISPPPSNAPRDVDDPDTLHTQGQLMLHLRGDPG